MQLKYSKSKIYLVYMDIKALMILTETFKVLFFINVWLEINSQFVYPYLDAYCIVVEPFQSGYLTIAVVFTFNCKTNDS